MKKYHRLEDMEHIFIERGFIIDCFDAYVKHLAGMFYRVMTTMLFIIYVVALCSFWWTGFKWTNFAFITAVWFGLRVLTTSILNHMIKSADDFTVNCKKWVGANLLEVYWEDNNRMSDADRQTIFNHFIASRIGLTPK